MKSKAGRPRNWTARSKKSHRLIVVTSSKRSSPRTAHGMEDRLQAIRTALGNDSDISDSTLRVLERPDWETLARRINMPDDVVKLLRQETAPMAWS